MRLDVSRILTVRVVIPSPNGLIKYISLYAHRYLARSCLCKDLLQISQYIKSLDSNHLVAFGGNGFLNEKPTDGNYDFNYDGDSGEDYTAVLALKGIDYGTVHSYTDFNNAQNQSYTLKWLKHHNDISVQASKPMLVGEIGVTNVSSELSQTDVYAALEQYLANANQSSAIQGVLLWSVDVMGRKCPEDWDPYAICQSNATAYSTLATDFAKAMAKKGEGLNT